jgi:hypothetical protein
MDSEKIIRGEAKDFFIRKIENSDKLQAIDVFHELKSRLYDFYSDEKKAIFIDEIEFLVKKDLQEHRDSSHGGAPGENCSHEEIPEKLIFYLRQEIETLPLVAHQKFKSKEESERNTVFISYAHIDSGYLSDIKRHFKPFLNQIEFWDDTKIIVGSKWKEEIAKAIGKTKVAILLVSTDFFGSDFISSNELPQLLESAEKEGTVILTIILKPCLFEEFEQLNQYQALNSPNYPVSKMDENEKEELFVNLVRQTKRILNEIK